MTVATLTSKGQVTIPVSVRRACNLESGARLDFVVASDDVIVVYTRLPTLGELYGSLANGVHSTIEEMDDAVADAILDETGL